MIVKSHIFAAGGRSRSRIPRLDKTMEEYCHGGKITVLSGLEAFSDSSFFTLSDRDTPFVFWCAFAFITELHDVYRYFEESESPKISETNVCRQDEVNEKRMDKGRYVFGRVSINAVADGAKVSIRVDNPYKIVGESEVEAREYSIVCAQIFLRIANIKPGITVTADDYIMARAKSLNDRASLRHIASVCPNRVNGFCSPINPHCPCYCNGKCEPDRRAEERGE